MPGVEQGFDFLLAATRPHVAVMEASLMIDRRVFVGIELEATRLAAERLLLRAIGTGYKMAARTFLGRVRRPTCLGGLPTFFGAPGELPGQVGQVASIQIGIGTAGLESHRAYIEIFVGNLMAHMIGVKLIDGPVYLLPDVAGQARVCEGRQARDALLFEAGAQFGLPAALLAITLVSAGELPAERAVALACAGCQ